MVYSLVATKPMPYDSISVRGHLHSRKYIHGRVLDSRIMAKGMGCWRIENNQKSSE